jgi:hypothetical protein
MRIEKTQWPITIKAEDDIFEKAPQYQRVFLLSDY